MSRTRVLQIGLDPDTIDFTPWPGQDARQLRARLETAAAAVREAGFDLTTCLVGDDPRAAAATVRRCVGEARYDVVEIGSGLRASHEHTAVFERVVNEVVALRPGVLLCFNDSPETTLAAVRRVLGR